VVNAEQALLSRPEIREFVEKKRPEFVGNLRDLAARGRALIPRLTG
jgi:hypothetical protein